MRNFIQKHPYLSCLGFNFIIVTMLFILSSEMSSHMIIRNSFGGNLIINYINFIGVFLFFAFLLFFTLISMLPAMCIRVIDLYANQKLFNNKPLQYGLTAVESLLFYPSILCIAGYKEFFDLECVTKEVITDVFGVITVLLTVLLLIQSLGFKYILDSANKKNIKFDFIIVILVFLLAWSLIAKS